MESLSRRAFLASSATAASADRVIGANDRIRLGAIGTGSRGATIMGHANQVGKVEWVAVCDAWDVRREQVKKVTGDQVASYADYRELLDRQDIDGVIIATFDHLHSQITVDACGAGKDVYVEKPMTSLPGHGLEVASAVRETGRIVQVGMQQRSMPHFQEAKERFFDTGRIGQVRMVRTVWNGNFGYLTRVPPGMERKPSGLDWDAVLGWLPKIPWDPKRYFNRFAYWDFSTGGQTGGLFVHMVDVVHWFLDLTHPTSAVALGGIYQYDDGRDTPDTINVILDYPERVNVTYEGSLSTYLNEWMRTRGGGFDELMASYREQLSQPEVRQLAEQNTDIVFIGTGGLLSIFRSGYSFLPAGGDGKPLQVKAASSPAESYLKNSAHMGNWLECMRSRQQPNADATAGHYSAMACHMANMAYREQRKIPWRKEWDL